MLTIQRDQKLLGSPVRQTDLVTLKAVKTGSLIRIQVEVGPGMGGRMPKEMCGVRLGQAGGGMEEPIGTCRLPAVVVIEM